MICVYHALKNFYELTNHVEYKVFAYTYKDIHTLLSIIDILQRKIKYQKLEINIISPYTFSNVDSCRDDYDKIIDSMYDDAYDNDTCDMNTIDNNLAEKISDSQDNINKVITRWWGFYNKINTISLRNILHNFEVDNFGNYPCATNNTNLDISNNSDIYDGIIYQHSCFSDVFANAGRDIHKLLDIISELKTRTANLKYIQKNIATI